MAATIDKELGQLAAERERLQPLEVNLQAATARTARARAGRSKAKEKKAQAAKELRSQMEAFKAAEREVEEAEAKLCAAEAAATAKRSETKVTGVQQAVDLLHQTATERCGDSPVAAQVAAALPQIAQLLGAITAPGGSGGCNGDQPTERAAASGSGGGGEGSSGGGTAHPVFAVCGATADKNLRTLPLPQRPSAVVGTAADPAPEPPSEGASSEMFAGGRVDGEVDVGNGARPNDENDGNLLAEAAAALGDAAEDKEL